MAKQNPKQDYSIDWILRDRRVIDGLDHLGIELVSVNLYQAMLPGLTNVTERARYYSFYPWVLHRFAQDGPKERSKRTWRTWFRSLDFAYAAACAAHEQQNQLGSGSSIVGADKAGTLVAGNQPGTMIDLSSACGLDENGNVPATGAYFKNPEGGFGQYYKGPLRELGAVSGHSVPAHPDVKLSNFAGLKIAQSLDGHQGFADLQQIALDGGAKVSDLARVGKMVHPTAIGSRSEEETLLRALLLGSDEKLCQAQIPQHRQWRRQSLLLVLQYVEDCGSLEGDPSYEFRWSCLANALPDGEPWRCPPPLASAANAWGAYQRNDLLNYSLETLFYATLLRLDDQPYAPVELAGVLADAAMAAVPASEKWNRLPSLPSKVAQWLDGCARPTQDPSGDPWGSDSTWEWADRLERAVKERDIGLIVALAARVLGRLATDTGTWRAHPFETIFNAEDMANKYEVHLKGWCDRANRGANQETRDFLQELLLEWVLFRHLRVATRKLANQGVSTYKYRPEEGQLLFIAEKPPLPTFTAPRIWQAFRILEDLHCLSRVNNSLELSADGRSILEASRA
jgi:hypothetical protein